MCPLSRNKPRRKTGAPKGKSVSGCDGGHTPHPALAEGLRHHQAGRLTEAEALYRQALDARPDDPDALHLLGMAAFQAGQPEAAVSLVQQALAVNPDAAQAHNTLGSAFKAQGETAAACEAFRRAVALAADYAEGWYNLGITTPDSDEALAALRRAVALNPGFAPAWNNLGNLLMEQGHEGEAAEALYRAIEVQPDFAEAHYNLGNLSRRQGDSAAAMDAFSEALKHNPDFAEAHNNLGLALLAQDRDGAAANATDAIDAFSRALAIRPGYAQAHNNLGNALKARGDIDAAIAAYTRALELDPDYAEAHNNLGHALYLMGNPKDGMAEIRRAIVIRQDYAEAHCNLAQLLFLGGDYGEGWREFSWRWRRPETPPRPFLQPQWAGEPPSGKTILVWGEQGPGDEIRHACALSDLTSAGARVLVECEPRLAPLFARSFPEVEAIPRSDPPHARTEDTATDAAIDFQISAGDLCAHFRGEGDAFSGVTPYLKADEDRTRDLRQRYGEKAGGRLVVGISWTGGNKDPVCRKRPPLADWWPLLETPDVCFVDLQYGETGADRNAIREATGVDLVHDDAIDALTSMENFAAQVMAVDLVITVGTSTAELAGALGQETWVLVPFAAKWYWGAEGTSCLWYPSARLFRQQSREQWRDLVAELRSALEEKAAEV